MFGLKFCKKELSFSSKTSMSAIKTRTQNGWVIGFLKYQGLGSGLRNWSITGLDNWGLGNLLLDYIQDQDARNRYTSSTAPVACGKHDRNNKETSNLSLCNHNKKSTCLPSAPRFAPWQSTLSFFFSQLDIIPAYHQSHPFCFISFSFINIGFKLLISDRRGSHWINCQFVPCCLRSDASDAIYSPVNKTFSQPRLLKYLSQVDDYKAAPHPSSSTFFG